MKHKILFIINPFSGIGKQKIIENLIDKALDINKFKAQIIYTEYAKHAIEISKKAIGVFDVVIAVGGDGTINEVGRSLVNSDVVFGLIPAGSGNGFARHLKIPLKPARAFEIINKFNTQIIDTGIINDMFFINLCGVGFDAEMGYKIEKLEKRGFRGNFKVFMTSLKNLKAKQIKFAVENKNYNVNSYIFTVANGSQYGFNAKISPNSSITDAWFEAVSINKFPTILLPIIAKKIFTGKIAKSKYCEIHKCKSLKIFNKEKLYAHVDGEPFIISSDIDIKIKEKSLKVIVV